MKTPAEIYAYKQAREIFNNSIAKMIKKLIEEVGELKAEIKRKITDKQLLKMELVDVVYVLNQLILKFGYIS